MTLQQILAEFDERYESSKNKTPLVYEQLTTTKAFLTFVWNSALESAEGCVPDRGDDEDYYRAQGYNICRTETLAALKKLKALPVNETMK